MPSETPNTICFHNHIIICRDDVDMKNSLLPEHLKIAPTICMTVGLLKGILTFPAGN